MKLESVLSETSRLETFLEALSVNCTLVRWFFTAVVSKRDQRRALVDIELLKHHNLESILADVRIISEYRSSFLCSPHEMFRYDVNCASHEYFCPLIDAVRRRPAAFRSASLSKVETHGETCAKALLP